jgi:hypothetical protein
LPNARSCAAVRNLRTKSRCKKAREATCPINEGPAVPRVRLYNREPGRSLTTDPGHSGNPNTYTYPVDPINAQDLDGNFGDGSRRSTTANGSIVPVAACCGYWPDVVADVATLRASHSSRPILWGYSAASGGPPSQFGHGRSN